MNRQWPEVPLGEVLSPTAREEVVDGTKEYRLLGVRLDGQGPFLRETVSGTQTSATKLFRVAKDDFIYSRLFACRGAFGVISEGLNGCYVSGEFPTFVPVANRVDVGFLRYWFRLPAVIERVNEDCSGSTPLTRNRFKEQFFLTLKMPLPPLAEQRRIVARIEALAAQIHEARALRHQAAEEAEALIDAAARLILGKPDRQVSDVADVTKLAGFEHTKYLVGALPGDVILLRAGNIRNSGLELENAATIPSEISDQLPRSQLGAGDVVMTFIGAKIGDVTFVTSEHPRLHCGPNVAKLTPKPAIEQRYLVAALQAPVVQEQIREITKLTAQPNLSMKTIRLLRLPVPSLPEQHHIVFELNALQSEVDALKRSQADIAVELDALLPSILDRAFKGEL